MANNIENDISNNFISLIVSLSPRTLLDVPYTVPTDFNSNELKEYIRFFKEYFKKILAIDLDNKEYRKFIKDKIIKAINVIIHNNKDIKSEFINTSTKDNTLNNKWIQLIQNENALVLLYILSSNINIKKFNLKEISNIDKDIFSINQNIAVRVYHNFLNQFSQHTANDNYSGLVKMCRFIDDNYNKVNKEGKLLKEMNSLENIRNKIHDIDLKNVFDGLLRFIKNLNNYVAYTSDNKSILSNKHAVSGVSPGGEKKVVLHDIKLRTKSPNSIDVKIGLTPEGDIRSIKDFIGVMFIIEDQKDIFLLLDILREIGFLDPHVVIGQKHDLNLLKRMNIYNKKESLKRTYKDLNNITYTKMAELISNIQSDKTDKPMSTCNIKSLFFYMTQNMYTGKTVTKDIPFEIQIYTAPSKEFIEFCRQKYKCNYEEIIDTEKTKLISNFISDKINKNINKNKIEELLLNYFGSYFLYLYHPEYGHEIYKKKQIEKFNKRGEYTKDWLKKLLNQ